MNDNQLSLLRQLQFPWMSVAGPSCSCRNVVHHGLSCFQEITIKLISTYKTISKFYILFHLIPYLLKLKKNIRERRFISSTGKAILNFIGSLAFMIHLVGGLKITLCAYSNLKLKTNGSTFILGGFPTAFSILWESNTRRQQITYYAFVRSVRSIYFYLKRRNLIKFNISSQFSIIMSCGLLCYFFTENPRDLKYVNIFQGLWGQL